MKNSILLIISLVFLIAGIYAGWHSDKDAVMTVCFLAFVLLLFVSYIEKIQEIKVSLSGVEAVTKEAKDTISELQSLAKIFAESTLTNTIRSGRMGSDPKHKEEDKIKILKVLDNLGIDIDNNKQILEVWNKYTCFDYVYFILGAHQRTIDTSNKELVTDYENLKGINNIPTPTKLREFFIKWSFLNDEIEELLLDYDYYFENGEHRRLQAWYELHNSPYIKLTSVSDN